MELKEFVCKFKNHPIFFLGAGISKRYCRQTFTWEELLKEVAMLIYKNDRGYYNLNYRLHGDFPMIAEFLEKDFNSYCQVPETIDEVAFVQDAFYRAMSEGKRISPFKIYIADKFKNYQLNMEKEEEVIQMKQALKNVCSVITTNYDGFVENELGFNPLIGNKVLLSNPYGSVYKIHGCYTQPESLVITRNDYEEFKNRYELIRAELVSMFIHHPIVFLGYGFGDENIQKIVDTIFSYVDPNTEEAQRVRDNFLVVEYSRGVLTTNVEDYVVKCANGATEVRLNKVSTDNFSELYQAISNLKLKVGVDDVRKIQSIMCQVMEGRRSALVEVDYSMLQDDDVVTIGMKTRYTSLCNADFRNCYFEYLNKKDVELVKVLDSISLQKNQYFPMWGYVQIYPSLTSATVKCGQQLERIRSLYLGTHQYVTMKTSIADVLSDKKISNSFKTSAIVRGALDGFLSCDDLENYLKTVEKGTTDYNKLLVVYDYLMYCPIEKRFSFD